ncbi:MFS transporter [Pallidibacillus pasinlerensis]|uniref:MFS transporter n=1 Tax=Pallidibacillus pasinlerensis TaxID=2703818 RepID=A0ABX0A4A2_9BACI|nr:MFS transporter [Pallidibacillus pasinlerensis]NCU17364.1 MFS transporter [Pallidibacillus pasinlerensis]
MREKKIFTKDFIILFSASFFVALIFYLLMTSFALYTVERFAASESEAGLAASIFIIGALFARLLAGKYIEVIGRKKLLYGSLILYLVAILFYFLANSLSLLLIIRFIHGMGFGASTTAMSTAVMDMIPYERKGEGTGYYTLSSVFATALGPFLALYLTQNYDFQTIFIICTIFTVFSLLLSLFAKIPEAEIFREKLKKQKSGFHIQDFIEMKALPISFMMVIIGIAYASIVSFINVYAIEIQLQDIASLFFIVYAIVLLFTRPITGRLLDLKGDNIVIYPAIIFLAICLVLLSQAENGIVLLLSGAFLALGFGTLVSSGQAIAVKEAPKERVGLAVSTFYICLDGGVGIGPYLIGFIIPFVGFRGMYFILALFVFLTVILYYFLHGKKAAMRRKKQLQEVS